MQNVAKTLIFTAVLALTGCSNFDFPGVYRINVQQGNIVERKKVEQVEVGMTRSQVRFVLGTPLIQDTFNPDRWDYYYSMRRGDGSLSKKHVMLHFDGDILASIESDLQADAEVSPEDVKEQLEEQEGVMPEDPYEDILGE